MCLGAEQVEVILQALNRNRTIAENTQSRKSKINLRNMFVIFFTLNWVLQEHRDNHPPFEGKYWYWSSHNAHCHQVIFVNLTGFLFSSSCGWVPGVVFSMPSPPSSSFIISSWIIIITIDYFHLWWCLWLTNSFYSNAGLVGGVLGMVFVAVITIHCMHVLVRAAQKMVARYL